MKNKKSVLFFSVCVLTLALVLLSKSGFLSFTKIFAAGELPNGIPSNVVAVPTSPSSVHVTWQDNATNETQFLVQRSIYNTFTTLLVTYTVNAADIESFDNSANVVEGTRYYYHVAAKNINGVSEYSPASGPCIVPIKAPTELVKTSSSQTSITLQWQDNSAYESIHVIERKVDSGQFAQLNTVSGSATNYKVSYIDNTIDINAHKFTYRIKSVKNATGYTAESEYSNEFSIGTEPVLPVTPTNITATASNGIVLEWQDNSNGEDGTKIERSDTAEGPFTEIASVGLNVTTYTDSSATEEAKSYFYRLRTFVGDVYSDYSSTASATTILKAPSNVTYAEEWNIGIITWTDNSSVEDGYIVEKKIDDAEWVVVADNLAADTSRYENYIDAGADIWYRVKCFKGNISSYYGESEDHISFQKITIEKRAPEKVSFGDEFAYTIEISNRSISQVRNVTVTDEIPSNIEFISCSEGTFVNGVLTSTFDMDPLNTKTIQVYVRLPITTKAPSELEAATSVNNAEVKLKWNDNSNNATSFMIERAEDSGFTENVAYLWVFEYATEYIDSEPESGKNYYYRVSAIAESGSGSVQSEPSNVLTVRTTGISSIAAPTDLIATMSRTNIILNWKDNSSEEAGFRIERVNTTTGEKVTFETGPDTESYIDSTVVLGNAYIYNVVSFAGATLSDPSYANVRFHIPAGPTNLSASVYHTSNIKLMWTDNSSNPFSESEFIIERSTSSTFATAKNTFRLPFDQTEYIDPRVDPNVTYYYRIVAANEALLSDPSNTASAKPLVDSSLAVPANLRVVASSLSTLTLQWDVTSTSPETIEVQITKAANFTMVDQIQYYYLSYAQGFATIDELQANTTYKIRARSCVYPDYYSGITSVITGTTVISQMSINAPTNLTADMLSFDTIELNWTDNSDNEEGFVVGVSPGNNIFTDPEDQLYWAMPDTTTLQISGLNIIQPYYFKVRAWGYDAILNSSIYSADSNIAYISPPVPIIVNAPTDLVGSYSSTSGTINLNWTDNSDNETGFMVSYARYNISPWVEESYDEIMVPANTIGYVISNIQAGKYYFVDVAAYREESGQRIDSGRSNYIEFNTSPN